MKAFKGGKSSGNKKDAEPNLLRVIKQHEVDGNTVAGNESATKFSAMLLELVEPYRELKGDYHELERLLNLAMIAWNIANMERLFPMMYNTMLEESKSMLGADKQAVKDLEKLVRDKKKKFPYEDMFIHDFAIKQADDSQFYVIAAARPFESLVSDTEMDEIDFRQDDDIEDDDVFNFDPGYINRNAITIKPRQPFLDWFKKKDENSLFPFENDENNTYLVEEKTGTPEMEKWLSKNFDIIFARELGSRDAQRKSWPKKRNYKMFCEWFEVSHSSMVYDIEDFPVDKD
ncbi:MAG: hypothetical protein ABI472_08440 [Ginsengibacter sp.]